jgi:hypothetical protein
MHLPPPSTHTRRKPPPNRPQSGAGSSAVEETLRQELAAQRDAAARLRSDLAAARQELQEVRGGWERSQIRYVNFGTGNGAMWMS